MGDVVNKLLGLLSDPSGFWLVYGTVLFCAFLLLVGVVENVILRKPLNAFLMGILFAAFVYLGVYWGKSVAPVRSVFVWQFGAQPVPEGICPASAPIKAVVNASGSPRCTYYFPGDDFYNQIKPDRCYTRTDETRADGCAPSNF